MHRVAIRGSCVGTLERCVRSSRAAVKPEVPPILLNLRPLDAAPETMTDLRAGHVRGGVILSRRGEAFACSAKWAYIDQNCEVSVSRCWGDTSRLAPPAPMHGRAAMKLHQNSIFC